MTDRDAALLTALVELGRPIIRETFEAASCIVSTRIGLDVLRYFGIPGREYPVSIMLFNADALAILDETQDMEALKAATAARTVEEEGGPWTIGLGAPELPKLRPDGTQGWPGHLVIGLRQWDVIVDLSLDQVSRPHKNLTTGATWYPIPSRWWDTTSDTDFVQLTTDGGATMFLAHRHDHGYRTSPNWRGISRGSKQVVRSTTGQIITALKGAGFSPSR